MARIVDVSRSGALLATTANFNIGERVLVGSKEAVIVRASDGGAAIRFISLLDQAFDASITL